MKMLTYRGLFLVKNYIGMPYESTKSSEKTFELCVAFVFDVDIARVSLECRSVTTITCCFSFMVLGSERKVSIATNSDGPDNGNICRKRFRL